MVLPTAGAVLCEVRDALGGEPKGHIRRVHGFSLAVAQATGMVRDTSGIL